MKHLAPLLLMFLLAPGLQAQRIHAYVASGATLSQIEGDELKGFRQVGFTGGVGALAAISGNYRWGLSLEALFSQRGAYNRTGDPYNLDLRMSYVDIPLLLHYQDPYGGMLFGLGLDYGRLVQQPHGNLRYNPNYFIPDTTDMTFLPHDLSVVADCRFTVWRGLQLNIRWQYSILAVKRGWTFSEYVGKRLDSHANDCYNHSLAFRLIWQF